MLSAKLTASKGIVSVGTPDVLGYIRRVRPLHIYALNLLTLANAVVRGLERRPQYPALVWNPVLFQAPRSGGVSGPTLRYNATPSRPIGAHIVFGCANYINKECV